MCRKATSVDVIVDDSAEDLVLEKTGREFEFLSPLSNQPSIPKYDAQGKPIPWTFVGPSTLF